MRIAIFSTCIGDAMFPQAPEATTMLLERLGHDVVFPRGQACCGQMHINTGYFHDALPLVRNHVSTFEAVLEGEWDAIVVPSGSCTGSIKHQQAMVARRFGESELARKADLIAEKTYDLPVLLTDFLGVEDVGAYFPHTLTYHPTCHSLRMTRVGNRPERLLSHVEGATILPLPDAEQCCGFGGTFSVKYPEVSGALVSEKVATIASTGAEVVVADDYSCLMNIYGRMARVGVNVRPMHLAEVLVGTRDTPWKGPRLAPITPAKSSRASTSRSAPSSPVRPPGRPVPSSSPDSESSDNLAPTPSDGKAGVR